MQRYTCNYLCTVTFFCCLAVHESCMLLQVLNFCIEKKKSMRQYGCRVPHLCSVLIVGNRILMHVSNFGPTWSPRDEWSGQCPPGKISGQCQVSHNDCYVRVVMDLSLGMRLWYDSGPVSVKTLPSSLFMPL